MIHPYVSKSSHIKWADVYFNACANEEVFKDATIVTAKSEYVNTAFEIAADIVVRQTAQLSSDKVLAVARCLIDKRKVYVYEYVRVDDAGITICINAENVEDEHAVWRALDMLADALRELDGAYGEVTVGHPLYFSANEVQWATTTH